jgi:streptomycin 3"-adenylyltransferase
MAKTVGEVSPVPTYAVLNFCRVLAFIEVGQVTSKRSGGEWALAFVPRQYHPVIQEALNEYAKTGSSKEFSSRVLKDFAGFSYEIIKKRWQ